MYVPIRRHLLCACLAAGVFPPVAASTPRRAGPAGPALLTLTGAVRPNCGPLDPALDQMMAKQQIAFDRAHTFDFAAPAALPATTIRPTLEHDARPHTLRGPLLADVLAAAGAPADGATPLALRAIDGYRVPITLAEARRLGLIVATHLDGAPMPLGGLGPLWAVLDADRSLFNVELSYTRTQADLHLAMIGLYKAMGGGWVGEADQLSSHRTSP